MRGLTIPTSVPGPHQLLYIFTLFFLIFNPICHICFYCCQCYVNYGNCFYQLFLCLNAVINLQQFSKESALSLSDSCFFFFKASQVLTIISISFFRPPARFPSCVTLTLRLLLLCVKCMVGLRFCSVLLFPCFSRLL